MALNFRKFLDGIRIIPKTTSTASEKGDLEVDNATGKLNYHNGSSLSPIVTETQGASQLIVSANSSSDAVRITQIGSGNALLVEDSANPDSTPFVIDANGNVGIGTATPSQKLNVVGNIETSANFRGSDGTVSAPSFTFSGDSNTGLWRPGSDIIAASTNGLERLRIDSSGNVGIGVSAPNAPLEIVGTNAGSALVVQRLRNAGTTLATASTLSLMTNTNSGAAISLASLSGIATNTAGGGDLAISTSSPTGAHTERLRIDSAGRVLINTTTARTIGSTDRQAQLQLEIVNTGLNTSAGFVTNGNDTVGPIVNLGKSRGAAIGGVTAVISGDQLGSIRFAGADGTDLSSRAAEIFGQVDGTVATGSVPGRILFTTTSVGSTTPTERLRIDSAGRVGVGIVSPVARLHVTGADSTFILGVSGATNGVRIGASSTRGSIEAVDSTLGASYQPLHLAGSEITVATSTTERLRIDSSGRVGIGTVSPQATVHIDGGVGGTNSFRISAGGTNSRLSIINRSDGGGYDLSVAQDTDNAANKILTISTGVTERIRLLATGLIGIATPTPATTLDLNGTFAIRFSNNVQTGTSITLTAPTTSYVRLTAAVTSVGGIAGGVNGQRVVLVNRTGSTISINNEDAAVTAANRIVVGTAASFNLPMNGSIEVVYDSTTSRWIVVGAASATTLVTTVSVDTVLTTLNDIVLVNASGAARTITLPTPTSGKIIRVKKTDSTANVVTISRSSTETIDGNNSVTLANQYDSYTMVSDGTNWFII